MDIKQSRVRSGLSQTELADKIGVTQATVSNWERGKGGPSGEQLNQLGAILGVEGESESVEASPLAAWLAKARVTRGWSVPERAHKAGLTAPAIYRIEAGVTRNLRDATRKKLEQTLENEIPADTAQEVADDAQIEGLGKLEDFDPHLDADRPDEPGVYMLYDISERPIYVGEGGNVRARIRDHVEKFWFKRPIVESASWIRVADKKIRKQLESLLIKFLKSDAVLNIHHVERNKG
jgi:transcriptional regulator with XRE-family HTH domain